MANKNVADVVFLSSVQVLNLIIPVFMFPYIVHAIGVAQFGTWTLISALYGFFQIITDYSFNAQLVNDYVMSRMDRHKDILVFCSLMIKSGLITLSLLVSIPLALWVFHLSAVEAAALSLFIVGNGISCFWVYQARGLLRQFSLISSLFRIMNALLIFIFVKNEDDFNLLLLLSSASVLVSGVVLNLAVGAQRSLVGSGLNLKRTMYYLKKGAPVVLTNLSITGYTNLKLIIVSRFCSAYAFGLFSIIDRLVWVIQTIPLTSVLQVLYPRLAVDYKNRRNVFFKKIRYYQTLVNGFYLAELLLFYALHEYLFNSILNVQLEGDFGLVLILFLVNSFITNTSAVKVHYFLISKSFKAYFNIHFYAALAGTALIAILASQYDVVGGIAAVLATTCVIVVFTHIIYQKHYEDSARRLGVSAI